MAVKLEDREQTEQASTPAADTHCEFCNAQLPDPLTWCCSVRIDRLLADNMIDEEGLGMFRLHPDLFPFDIPD